MATTDTNIGLVGGTYNLPQDPSYLDRDALVVHTYRDESEPKATFYLGRNSGKTWDMSVYFVSNDYLSAQLAARDLGDAVIAELPHLEHSIFSHTPQSKGEFEGQTNVDRDHYDGLHTVRRFHVNNLSNADLPKVAEKIFKGLGIAGDKLAEANNHVGDYMSGAFTAEKMSDERTFRAIAGNVFGFLTGHGWKKPTTLGSQAHENGRPNWPVIYTVANAQPRLK